MNSFINKDSIYRPSTFTFSQNNHIHRNQNHDNVSDDQQFNDNDQYTENEKSSSYLSNIMQYIPIGVVQAEEEEANHKQEEEHTSEEKETVLTAPKDDKVSIVDKMQKNLYYEKNMPKKAPVYNAFNSDVRSVLLNPDNMNVDGYQFSQQKTVLAQNPVLVLNHSLSLGSVQQPPNYNLSLNYKNRKTDIQTQLNPDVFVTSIDRSFKNFDVNTFYMRRPNETGAIQKEWKAKTTYRGDYHTTTLKAELPKKKVIATFNQNISKSLTVGTKLDYDVSTRKSSYSVGASFKPVPSKMTRKELKERDYKDNSVSVEYTYSQRSERSPVPIKNNHIVTGSIVKKLDPSTTFALEGTYESRNRGFTYSYGYQQEFLESQVQVTVDQDMKISTSFMRKLDMMSQVQVFCQADVPKSDIKFGLSLNILG